MKHSMTDEQSFADYRNRLDIRDVLIDAGYTQNKRDGLRYPAFVRTDRDGRRIRGDNFLVSPGKNCCFQPPTIKSFSVTSFIWEHPELFPEYKYGMKESALVHQVCQRLLNMPIEQRKHNILDPIKDSKPFDIKDYGITRLNPDDFNSAKPFFSFFKSRGIDLNTAKSFHRSFFLASRIGKDGATYKNLAFPMYIPGMQDKYVGLEERGYPRKDGSARKGMASGTNASEGVWIGSPNNTDLKDAKQVFVFESAYDAMAFYQLRMKKDSGLDHEARQNLKSAVYISTGGNPSYGQIQGLIKNAPQATFHLGFDNDQAGKQFVHNFKSIAQKFNPLATDNISLDMKEFIEAITEPIHSTKDLMNACDEYYHALPKELKDLYLHYDSAREEALECHYSPFLCKEDKHDAADKMNRAYQEFKTALFQKLNLKDGQSLAPIKIVREEPREGYKDFNDELLEKKQDTLADVVVTALDENGTSLTMERQDEGEETKRHGIKR